MSKPKDDLSVSYVRSILSYDPVMGLLWWRSRTDRSVQWNGKFAGKIAGWLNDRGYVIVTINGKDYRAHRLAAVIMNGTWPEAEIDHRALSKSDNRWDSLRDSTHVQNNQNKKAQSNNTSGFKGVSFCKMTNLWVARIKIGDKYVVVGKGATPLEASFHYNGAAEKHHGEFANYTKGS